MSSCVVKLCLLLYISVWGAYAAEWKPPSSVDLHISVPVRDLEVQANKHVHGQVFSQHVCHKKNVFFFKVSLCFDITVHVKNVRVFIKSNKKLGVAVEGHVKVRRDGRTDIGLTVEAEGTPQMTSTGGISVPDLAVTRHHWHGNPHITFNLLFKVHIKVRKQADAALRRAFSDVTAEAQRALAHASRHIQHQLQSTWLRLRSDFKIPQVGSQGELSLVACVDSMAMSSLHADSPTNKLSVRARLRGPLLLVYHSRTVPTELQCPKAKFPGLSPWSEAQGTADQPHASELRVAACASYDVVSAELQKYKGKLLSSANLHLPISFDRLWVQRGDHLGSLLVKAQYRVAGGLGSGELHVSVKPTLKSNGVVQLHASKVVWVPEDGAAVQSPGVNHAVQRFLDTVGLKLDQLDVYHELISQKRHTMGQLSIDDITAPADSPVQLLVNEASLCARVDVQAKLSIRL